MKRLVYAFMVVLYACGAPEHGGAALELAPKDGAGKPRELAPYDDEPDAAALAPDAGVQALPDAGEAAPDAHVEPSRDAQAPRADATAPTVDAGPPATLAGWWRVTVSPVGMPCAGARGRVEDWNLESTETTIATPLGTLSRVQNGFEGVLELEWAVTAVLTLDGPTFSGTYARKGLSCSDRWTLAAVRP